MFRYYVQYYVCTEKKKKKGWRESRAFVWNKEGEADGRTDKIRPHGKKRWDDS